jgi:tripartite-type tricarboxylate transporter receptor subunit TctC
MNRPTSAMGALVLLCAAITLPPIAQAQEYPTRPIRLIVPFAPGGTSDIVGRLVASRLGENLGQQVVVDNRAGAGATLGTRLATQANPDGYTLIVAHQGLAFNETLHPGRGYDAAKELTAISLIGATPSAIVVNNEVPAKTVKELIALARAQPGKLTYGSGGVGGTSHLSVELFQSVADVKLVHVPYKGAGPAMIDLIGGQVHLGIPTLPSAIGHARAGRLRMLAVTGEARSPAAPDLPTAIEAGLPGYTYSTWYALWSRTGTPRAVIEHLNKAVVEALESAALREKLASQGVDPQSSTPEYMNKLLRSDIERWGRIIKEAGIPLVR